MIWIGIDPGLDGAVAVIGSAGDVATYDTPTGVIKRTGGGVKREYFIAGMAGLLAPYRGGQHHFDKNNKNYPVPAKAAIEAVHSMPEQGVASSFAFGQGFGIWLGLLAGLEIPFDMVTPQRWKKALLDGMGKEKDASRVRAQQLFPGVDLRLKKHHGRADALLIAEWRRRQG